MDGDRKEQTWRRGVHGESKLPVRILLGVLIGSNYSRVEK